MRRFIRRFQVLSADDVSALIMAWVIGTVTSVLGFAAIGVLGIPIGLAVAIVIFVGGGMI